VDDALKAQADAEHEERERLRAEEEAKAETDKPTEVQPQTPEPVTLPEPANGEASTEDSTPHWHPKTMISLAEAKELNPDAELGAEIKTELFPPTSYGRMAAQTAKQVIVQRLREAERETIYKEYKGREGEILSGIVQRVEGRMVLIDLGHTTALMPPSEQIEREQYTPGLRLKLYLIAVNLTPKGPEIIVSRSHPEMIRKFFTVEVPEVQSGAVELKSIAREAGSRAKVAVFTDQKNIDPVGSCVGQRGTRVQTIIGELNGEKIDIIEWSSDAVKFISNALSPAKVMSIKLDEDNHSAIAEVKEDQLSLAIGKSGQNVRLAAKLTGWKIDIVGEGQDLEARQAERQAHEAEKTAAEEGSEPTEAPAAEPTETPAPETAEETAAPDAAAAPEPESTEVEPTNS